MSLTSSFRVANLANLFWDNGSYKYPNTYPRLINGWNPKKTPVMTSPIAGWVILEGDWNYCEYNGNLFFLKKAEIISIKRNKWKYILIKDHICSLFKNRADVIAYGTLVNTDLDNLKDNDFQYTFPVFNNYNKRILIPMEKELFNWRKHSKKIPITKTFEPYCPWTDVDFSNFVWALEETNNFFTKSGDSTKLWSEVVKENDYLVVLGSFGACKNLVKGWKQELVEKINALLLDIPNNEDIVAGTIHNSVILNADKLNGRIAISYKRDNPLFNVQDETRELDIDLSGLTDIELINFDTPTEYEKYSRDQFNLFLGYSEHKVTAPFKDDYTPKVYKLSRRVRIPFMSASASRAVMQASGQFYPFAWIPFHGTERQKLYLPQKIFIKGAKALIPKQGEHHYLHYPVKRFAGENYRSVYLYWCYNWNFYFVWGPNKSKAIWTISSRSAIQHWITSEEYFSDKDVLKGVSGDVMWVAQGEYDITVVPSVRDFRRGWEGGEDNDRVIGGGKPFSIYESYPSYFPWNTLKEPINIGWLLGQFSSYIEGQSKYFNTKFPFVIDTAITKGKTLKRLKGFKTTVGELVHLEDLYDEESFQYRYTLSLFNPLSEKQRAVDLEEDFLLGEKLLFSSWGMAPYLLFQPLEGFGDIRERVYKLDDGISTSGYLNFGYGGTHLIDSSSKPQLVGQWLTPASYHYGYVVFGNDDQYLKSFAKEWYKKAYSNYEPLEYKKFYSSDNLYGELKQHITKNTGTYFVTDEVTISNTPLKELKVNDIFYSDLEWFWFDAGGGVGGPLKKSIASDFLTHKQVASFFNHGDIVCYINPKDKKIYLGEAKIWKSAMNLPPNQFIAIETFNSTSTKSTVDVTYTRIHPASDERVITPNQSFDSLDTLIAALKQARYLKQNQPRDLKQLQAQDRGYLFNLKGTPFLCTLDKFGKVSLIFKNKENSTPEEWIED